MTLRPPWLLLGGLTTVLVAGIASQPAPATRVAVRGDCTKPSAWERAAAIAPDVWSEHRAPGMPLDVVVSSRDLPRLVHYQVLVSDIDAVARAERVRLASPQAAQPADWFGDYKDYRAISERMIELA